MRTLLNRSGDGRAVLWVDIAVLNKKFQSADDIARPRRKVVDDDQQLAYIGGGGLGNALLRCGWSASGYAPHRDRKHSGIGNSSTYTRWSETVTVRQYCPATTNHRVPQGIS